MAKNLYMTQRDFMMASEDGFSALTAAPPFEKSSKHKNLASTAPAALIHKDSFQYTTPLSPIPQNSRHAIRQFPQRATLKMTNNAIVSSTTREPGEDVYGDLSTQVPHQHTVSSQVVSQYATKGSSRLRRRERRIPVRLLQPAEQQQPIKVVAPKKVAKRIQPAARARQILTTRLQEIEKVAVEKKTTLHYMDIRLSEIRRLVSKMIDEIIESIVNELISTFLGSKQANILSHIQKQADTLMKEWIVMIQAKLKPLYDLLAQYESQLTMSDDDIRQAVKKCNLRSSEFDSIFVSFYRKSLLEAQFESKRQRMMDADYARLRYFKRASQQLAQLKEEYQRVASQHHALSMQFTRYRENATYFSDLSHAHQFQSLQSIDSLREKV
eukprot:CAMPEP_0117428344 /NCGR_PEP_ID=MMETSP0758-20121206/8082_1 /TAXON_ID=63605 /ORGANISM="Percolomonas cosmopolitus, Strain AE-1 (ATCC 50343)" /LENGTH=382 /DNA_ID=CAMNT_0005214667 /DNA_START=530 /DNA_END=1674 /DNA_ORIENTATION=-